MENLWNNEKWNKYKQTTEGTRIRQEIERQDMEEIFMRLMEKSEVQTTFEKIRK